MAKVEISFQALKIKVEDKKESADDCVKIANKQLRETVVFVEKHISNYNKKEMKRMKELSKLPIIEERYKEDD